MASKLKIHDTCGVNNLHGMPGVLAGVIGAIVSALATEDSYGLRWEWFFTLPSFETNFKLQDSSAVGVDPWILYTGVIFSPYTQHLPCATAERKGQMDGEDHQKGIAMVLMLPTLFLIFVATTDLKKTC